jgi:type I restriction enzyme, S subunit
VSELPSGWANAALADLGTWCGGGTPSKSRPEFWTDGTIPWVSPKDMKVRLIADAEDHITAAAVDGSATNVVPAGTVLAVTRSGILRRTFPVAVTTTAVALNQDLKALMPVEGIDSHYVFWFLRSEEQSILYNCSKDGTTVDSIDFPALLRWMIPIAPPAEQKRIVAAIEEQFSRLDAGVAALQRALQNLKRTRTALLQALVVADLGLSSNKRSVQNSELPQLPDGWYWTSLGSLIAEGPQNGLYLPASRYGSGVPILRIDDFQNDWVRPKEDLKHVNPDPEQTKTYALAVGDFVINRVNSMTHLGKCTTVTNDLAGALFESNMMRIRLTKDIEGSYLALYLRSSVGRSLLLKNAKWAVNQASINQADVRAVPVVVPPFESQERIVSIYETVSLSLLKVAEDIQTNFRRSNSLRSSILLAAFSGKLVPQDPTEESASVLLGRIAAKRASSIRKKSTRTRKPQGTRAEVIA